MTPDHEKTLRELVADKLSDALANIVYDHVPWKSINDAASEAHCDYVYDKGCEMVDAVRANASPALKALLAELDALRAVADAARGLVDGVEQKAEYVGPHAELVYTFSTNQRDVDALEAALAALDKEPK